MQKRGQIPEIYIWIGVLIAGFLIVWFSVQFLPALLGVFTGPSPEKAEIVENFQTLQEQINEVITDSEKIFDNIPYSISSDFILIGFSKDTTQVQSQCYTLFKDDPIKKPFQCRTDSACLCLFDSDFEVQQCLNINADYVFTYDADDYKLHDPSVKEQYENFRGSIIDKEQLAYYDNYKGKYAELILYGDCGPTFGVKNLYIEKHEDPKSKEVSVFIALASDSTEIRSTIIT